MIIDAEKLEADIEAIEKLVTCFVYFHDISPESFQRTIEAARAHLATLPIWKEIEVVRWGIVTPTGHYSVSYNTEAAALRECPSDHQVVRLTGTAKVKVQ